MRLFYAAGPGDILRTYESWRQGRHDALEVAETYSGQFFDVCRDHDIESLVVSSCPREGRLDDGRFHLRHVPYRNHHRRLAYHCVHVWYGLRMLAMALRFRPDAAVVTSGTTHWFVIRLFGLFGIQVIPSFHCTLWPKIHQPRKIDHVLKILSVPLFRSEARSILSISEDVTAQLLEITGDRHRPIRMFRPTFRPETFRDIPPPDRSASTFNVLFVGRVEANKGVFDLLDVAIRFHREGREDVHFDLCGSGTALEELRARAGAALPEGRFRLLGHCSDTKTAEMYGRSHVVVVPTRSDFIEGFNKVVVEGVLAGRPVVSSTVCPAIWDVREAVVEATPDDPKSYGDAIVRLIDEPYFYREKLGQVDVARARYAATAVSWGASLRAILEQEAPARLIDRAPLLHLAR